MIYNYKFLKIVIFTNLNSEVFQYIFMMNFLKKHS